MKKTLLLALAGIAGIVASTAVATGSNPNHPTTSTDYHPPTGSPPVCNQYHPCHPPTHPPTQTGEHPPTHPPVTVTVTTPAPPAATVTTTLPAPPAVTTTTPAPPAATTPGQTTTVIKLVEKPYPPCARGYKRIGKANCYRTKTIVKIKRVIRDRICPDPPPVKVPGCVGDCGKVFEGGSG